MRSCAPGATAGRDPLQLRVVRRRTSRRCPSFKTEHSWSGLMRVLASLDQLRLRGFLSRFSASTLAAHSGWKYFGLRVPFRDIWRTGLLVPQYAHFFVYRPIGGDLLRVRSSITFASPTNIVRTTDRRFSRRRRRSAANASYTAAKRSGFLSPYDTATSRYSSH